MDTCKELKSLLEEMNENRKNYRKSFCNFNDVPPKYIADAIYSHYINRLETIINELQNRSRKAS